MNDLIRIMEVSDFVLPFFDNSLRVFIIQRTHMVAGKLYVLVFYSFPARAA